MPWKLTYIISEIAYLVTQSTQNMDLYMQLQDIYNAIDYYEIFFNKIKQGLVGVASDLDITKACKAIQVPGMIISKEEFMSHVSW